MRSLVILEQDGTSLKATNLSVIGAAQKLGTPVDGLLMAGEKADALVAVAASIAGLEKLWVAEAAHYSDNLAENQAPLVAQLAKNYSHVFVAATSFGKNLLPRAAALLDVAPVSEVIEIISPDTFKRPIYAGNAIATVQVRDAIKLCTIRTTAFEAVHAGGGHAVVERIAALPDSGLSHFVSRETPTSERPELTAARIVVSGGRGLQSAAHFKMLEQLAATLGAGLGASRAAVDAGYVPNDYQVGQTGKIIAPELYIAIGISGAIQHLAGMKDSKIIVAINKDPDAPIFSVADFGLVGDLFQIVPELIAKLQAKA